MVLEKPSITLSILISSSNIAMAMRPLLIVRLIAYIDIFRSFQLILFLSLITMFIGGSIFLGSSSNIDIKSTNIDRGNLQRFRIDRTFYIIIYSNVLYSIITRYNLSNFYH